MHDKLKLLLEQINLSEDKFNYFSEANLDKISISKQANTVKFIISNTLELPLNVYIEILDLINKHFNMYTSCSLVLKQIETSYTYINDYYNNIIDKYTNKSPLLEMFKGVKLTVEDNNLVVELSNKAEVPKVNTIKEKLETDLLSIGYNLSINTIVNTEASNAILTQIE